MNATQILHNIEALIHHMKDLDLTSVRECKATASGLLVGSDVTRVAYSLSSVVTGLTSASCLTSSTKLGISLKYQVLSSSIDDDHVMIIEIMTMQSINKENEQERRHR